MPSRHWLYRQNVFKIFNEINPPATITTNIWYLRLLIAMIILGVAVMFKRVYVSISLGKKKYVAYGPQMESIMRKVLLIAEVAMLAEDIEYSTYTAEQLSHKKSKVPSTGAIKANLVGGGWLFSDIRRESVIEDQQDEAGSVYSGTVQREPDDVFQIDDVSDRNVAQGPSILVKDDDDDDNTEPNTFATKLRRQIFNKSILKKESKKIFNESERIAIEKLLGEWEEPELYKKASWKDTSIQKILEFRETLNYMDGGNPLSVPFGPASTRKECLKSSQKVYHKLLLQSPENQILRFEKLLVLAVDKKGKLNKTKARALIRLFRPDRKGNLTLLDFVRSCDHLYKKVKMFRATTANATQLDDALENLLNVAFYTILTVVLLLVMQVDFLTVFSTLAGIILPLSFLFSTAASLYFQGVLLVLVRQPYDIGDRIALSKPENDTDKDGSTSWFVEQISLFSTTVRNAATNEVATYSNSSLAPLRIINAARSPKAVKTLRLKFAIDVSLDKIKLFGASVEEFVKERPREWIKMACFRPTLIEADLGFVQYIVVLQHQESWQSIGSIKKSLADVASFCLELSKKLEMKYHTPPMPVNLSLAASMHPDGADPIVPTDIIGGGAFLNESNVRQSKDTISQIMNLFPRSPRSSNEKKVT
jgi:small-conductance mechanosensitive channel